MLEFVQGVCPKAFARTTQRLGRTSSKTSEFGRCFSCVHMRTAHCSSVLFRVVATVGIRRRPARCVSAPSIVVVVARRPRHLSSETPHANHCDVFAQRRIGLKPAALLATRRERDVLALLPQRSAMVARLASVLPRRNRTAAERCCTHPVAGSGPLISKIVRDRPILRRCWPGLGRMRP